MIVRIVGSVGPGCLADPDDTLVGVNLDDEAGRRQARAAGPLERLPHWRPHGRGMDARDPHRRSATLGPRCAIVNYSVIVNNHR